MRLVDSVAASPSFMRVCEELKSGLHPMLHTHMLGRSSAAGSDWNKV